MKIFDIDGNIVENPDLTIGQLIPSIRPIIHKYIITREEKGHYKTIKEYKNGGKDVEWIVDIPEEGHWETYDEDDNKIEVDIVVPDDAPHEMDIYDEEEIFQYILFTEDELEAMNNPEPSLLDTLEAQVIYTAMCTDTLL